MLVETFVCFIFYKIADFGLSRDLQDKNYYTSHGGKIPVKWTAPEAILYRRYSSASDVWSYGVLVYEIWSLGEKPYKDYTNQQVGTDYLTVGLSHTLLMQVIENVGRGRRLAPPSGCPKQIYQIMINCW